MRAALFIIVALASITTAHAQQPAPAAPADDPCSAHSRAAFDVATIKPSEGSPGSSSINDRADGSTVKATLRRIMLYAFDLREFQLTGGPDWVNTAVWEVRATVDPPEPEYSKLDEAAREARRQRQRQRMQRLLMERFQLKCHTVEKEMPIYTLTVAKGGPKLTPAAANHSISTEGSRRGSDMKATGISMDELAAAVSRDAGRLVENRTGLAGTYDLKLSWANDTAPGPDTDAESRPTIFTALEEQLGLKLVPAKGPVPVLVIDSVEKPSEN